VYYSVIDYVRQHGANLVPSAAAKAHPSQTVAAA
jgi:hypothetical protein